MSIIALKSEHGPDIANNQLLETRAYINGEWVEGKTQFPVTNPATGEGIAQVADLGAAETKQAVEAAYKAFESWKDMTALERSKILREWYDLQMENVEALAQIMTAEQGKPLAEARGEIQYGAAYTEWYAEEAKRAYGDIMPSNSKTGRITVLKQPVGVVGAITPWNFPSAMITRKISPALAAGCTVVLKPAEDTPLSALALAKLAEEAGVPKGVINIVTTSESSDVGEVLTSDTRVRKISFTGSTAVGRKLMEQSASTIKKISLELGGNGAFVIFDDADLDKAARDLAGFKFKNCGQICTNANRIFVQDTVYDDFLKKFKAEVENLTLGNGMNESTDVGPMINKKGLEKVQELVADALEQGGEVVTGGETSGEGDLFYQPTIIKNATPKMRFFSEEIFGPVAPLYKFKDEAEALKLANDTEYGLANYAYTQSAKRARIMSEGLESGIVAINTASYSAVQAPFGGYKQSGLGREGGKYGLEEFLETKYVYTDVE